MELLLFLLVFGIIAWLAVIIMRAFDRTAGRGPKQVSDGIRDSAGNEERIPCPMCGEKILSTAKLCRFCKTPLNDATSNHYQSTDIDGD